MTYEDFFKWVLPVAPTVPDPTAIDHIRNAAIEFCSRTRCWSEQLDPVTADGSSEYALNIDQECEVSRLLEVRVDSDDYPVRTARDARRLISDDPTERVAYTRNGRDLILNPAPASGSIVVEADLRPSIESTEFPDDVFALYAQRIAHGALASLLAMPKKDWSDPELAGYHHGLFERAINSTAPHGPMRVKPAPL